MKTADGLHGLFLKVAVAFTACLVFACGEDGTNPTDTGSTSRCVVPCNADQVCDEVLGICISNRDASDDPITEDVADDPEDIAPDRVEETVELDSVEEVQDSDQVEDSDPIEDPDVADDPDVVESDPEPEVILEDADVDVEIEIDESDAVLDSDVTDSDAADLADQEADAPDLDDRIVNPVSMGVNLFLPEDFEVTWSLVSDDEVEYSPPTGFLVRWGDVETELGADFRSTARESGLIPGETYTFEVVAYIGEDPDSRLFATPDSETKTIPTPTGIAVHPISAVLGSYGEAPVTGEVGQSMKLSASLTYPGLNPIGIANRAGFEVVDENTHTPMAQVTASGLVEALAPGEGYIEVSYGWGETELSAQTQLEVVPIYGATGSITVDIDTGASNPTIDVRVVGTGTSADPGRPFGTSTKGNTPHPIGDLRPGRHHLAFESDDYVPFDVTVNLRPGEHFVLNRIMLPFDSCERITAESGGTLTASDGATLQVHYSPSAVNICLTALPADAGPWNGPSVIADLIWPTQYHIAVSPNPASAIAMDLSIPVNGELADWIVDDLGTTTLPTLWRLGGSDSVGPAGSLVSGDSGSTLQVSISAYNRTMAVLACPGIGSQAGACRVEIDACTADIQFDARPREPDDHSNETECNGRTRVGGILELGNQLVLSDSAGLMGSLSSFVNPALGHTLGAWEVQISDPLCSAYACPAENPTCDCIAVVHEVGCGRSYSGSVTLSDGDDWQTLTNFEFVIPDFNSQCGFSYEACDGGACEARSDQPVTCSSACGWSP